MILLLFPSISCIYLPHGLESETESEVAQSCPNLCDPVDCSLPDSSVHGILQARILEWVSISFSRGSSQHRDWTWASRIGGRHFNLWATCLQCRRHRFDSWVGKICWRKDRLPTPAFLGFPCGLAGKDSACNVGDLGSVSGLVRSPGEGKDYPIQYSGLENSMDCRVHGVTKSWTQLSNFHFDGLGFCLIISSNNLPAYFCFCLEYGQISSK